MKKLSVYLMAGPETPDLAEAAVAGGADLLELGFPFSDPLADGPVIRLAGERALAQGMRTRPCLDCLAEVRKRVAVPLIPMTYASLLEAYGYERFRDDAHSAGATSLIVADLPVEAAPELPRVQLVAPTTPTERIRLAAENTDGWLYLVSLTGTTGARESVSSQLSGLVERARSVTDVPLLAGFGISTPEQAASAAALADGVVVGSRAVQVAEEGGPEALRDYVASLRTALDGAKNSFHDGASSPGWAGGCEARTQGASISGDMDATEDAASSRPARPGGSAPHCETGSNSPPYSSYSGQKGAVPS